jgi:Fe-S cluster assembly ATP-binding protein
MLELVNLSFKVDDDGNKKEILNDVSLTLEDGKFLVITGPNGGGKSTLAKLIMGIEKPTGGKILWNGTDITDMSITERAKLGIGYAFQQPPRFKGLTVRDLLSLAHGDTLPEDQCCTYLTSVGLCSKDYLNREVDATLSGGEIKRIEIATIMARNVSLAIYDEPEAGIDLWSFNMLIESFKNISSQQKQSMIIISHQERIMKIADEIAIIANGTVKKKGAVDEVFPLLMDEFNNVCNFR